jgi:hypothetical protein
MGELLALVKKVLAAVDGGVTVDEALALLDEVIHAIRAYRKAAGPVVADLDGMELDDDDVRAIVEEYGVVSVASEDADAIPPGLAKKLLKWAVKALMAVLL